MDHTKCKCADMHVHTKRSDGGCTIEEVVKLADAAGLRAVAITDHDVLPPMDLIEYEKYVQGRVKLIRGVEISSRWHTRDRSKWFTVHITALFCPEHAPNIQAVLERNRKVDKSQRHRETLRRLNECGVGIGTYEEICDKHPGRYIGKAIFAEELNVQGFVSDVDDAYRIYLAEHGERRAYVPDTLPYVPMDEVVAAIHKDGGLSVLAHMDSYPLEDGERLELAEDFAWMQVGRPAGMEVYVGRYATSRWAELKKIATKLKLYPIPASDFHGNSPRDTLDRKLPYEPYAQAQNAHDDFYGCPMILI